MDAGQVTFLAAVIAAVVSLVVAGITTGVGLLTSGRQRTHERSLARVEREFQRRSDAYVEALTLVNRGMDWVNRTMPVMTPAAEAPPFPDEDTIRRANALVALFGSPGTLSLMRELAQKQREFALHVDMHEDAKAARKAFEPAGEPGAWLTIEATRESCRGLAKQIEESMRTDLARE